MNKNNPLIRLLFDSKKHLIWLCFFVFLAFGAGIIQTNISLIFGNMVDLGINNQLDNMFALILPIGLLLIADIIRVILTNMNTAIGVERVFLDVRLRVYNSLLNSKFDALNKNIGSGDIVQRVNTDINSLSESVAGQFTWFLRVLIMAVVAFISCLILSWQLSAVFFVLLPLSIFITGKVSKPIEKIQKEQSANVSKAMNTATDMLHSLMTTKAFNLENEMSNRFAIHSDNAVESSFKINKTLIKLDVVKYISTILPVIATILMGLFLLLNNATTVGTIVAFIAISVHIRTALELMSYMSSAVRRVTALSSRVYEVIDLPVEGEALTNHQSFAMQSSDTAINTVLMKDVYFKYNNETSVLNGINLKINHGEKVGIVGPSGSGKSTIINLVTGLYPITNGQLHVFGHLACNWQLDDMRSNISIVAQNPGLFDGTIYENIACGKKDSTEKEVLEAAKNANLSKFIASLPNGINTNIGEGGNKLSGGQKQRIAIARAMLKNAPLLLLDEATSALDSESEIEVSQALEMLLQNTTTKKTTAIIVAHRLSTLKNVDRIIFIENGVVVEEGTIKELLALKGRFFEMSAFEGGIE